MSENERRLIENIIANLDGDEARLTRDQLAFLVRVTRRQLKAPLAAERERNER